MILSRTMVDQFLEYIKSLAIVVALSLMYVVFITFNMTDTNETMYWHVWLFKKVKHFVRSDLFGLLPHYSMPLKLYVPVFLLSKSHTLKRSDMLIKPLKFQPH